MYKGGRQSNESVGLEGDTMQIREGFIVIIVLALACGLTGCAKKEATEEVAAEEYVADTKPSIPTGEMVLIPAGEFIMGSNAKESPQANPEHKVYLPAFWIDKYEVSNYEFLEFSINNRYTGEGAKEGRDWRLFATPDKALNPVVYITWKDAEAYCKSKGKRLPTEEEWEKAARGPNGFGYPWGNEWAEGRANTYEAGLGKPADIGQFDDVSPYGVHDMLGNVQEWTASWYKTYKGNPKKDPNSGEQFKVVRGLSSRYKGKVAHLWERTAYVPTALFDFGCRCAKDATPEDVAKAGQAK